MLLEQCYLSRLLVILTLREAVCRSSSTEEDSFKAVLYNTSSCAVEQPWLHTNVTVHSVRGHTVLRGTIVATRAVKDVKFRIRVFQLTDGSKSLLFALDNMDCRKSVVRLVLDSIGLPFDVRKCTMDPGSWEFKNLDLDYIIQTVPSSMRYIPLQARWEIVARAAPLMCLDINYQYIRRSD